MRAGDEDYGTVELGDVVQEDHKVDQLWRREVVNNLPGGVVLVPRKSIPSEARFRIDLELVDVDIPAQYLLRWNEEPWMTGEGCILRLAHVRGVERANGVAVRFGDAMLALNGRVALKGCAQGGDLVGREQVGQDEQAIALVRGNFI